MKTVIVEFSLSQKAFHKIDMSEIILNNFRTILQRRQTDFLPVGFFKTNEEADEFIKDEWNRFKDYKIFQNTEGEMVVAGKMKISI